ncbi:ABC transporter substrate-binding protein [Microvirga sp. KLBC 81]|uniref:ABC transporter substrate-binding protein n=1 Tax=Microvirga sp. KLBC 81 TaxID=1862707 RepID=UPI000D51265D|nr:ABC transporter substrate-binding protein [Microvirga sp. KLBC 81]
MRRRTVLTAAGAAVAMLALRGAASAQETMKIGLILPMTGSFASTGRQIEAAAKLYMQQSGDTVAGKKIQLIVKDDTGVADVTKRLAQELIVNDKVGVIAGFGLTPLALAPAPLATQAKVPAVVMAAATATITEASPYIVRTSFTLPQATVPMADWASQNGIKKVVTLVSDYGPGIDAEKAFSGAFGAKGGQVESLRVPLANPDFSPFLQKVADAKPDALFVFVPSGVGAQFVERGLDKSGIKLIGPGDVTDDDILNGMGDVALGAITTQHYSAAHDSPENKAFVEAFKKANNGMRPNFMAVGGYDGMHLIYEGLKKTNGAGGEALINAMKGMSWMSPRGPVSIDPQTRDIIQNIYVRKVERVNGELYNVEFATIANVKDPVKAAKSN